MAFPTSIQSPVANGISPSGALGAQLQAITRRAVVPSVFVQIYQTHPVLSAFLSNARKLARGGFLADYDPGAGRKFRAVRVGFLRWRLRPACGRCGDSGCVFQPETRHGSLASTGWKRWYSLPK